MSARTIMGAVTIPVAPEGDMPPSTAPTAPPPLPPDPEKAWASILEARKAIVAALGLPPNADQDTIDAALQALAAEMQQGAAMSRATREEINTLAFKYKLSRDFVRACFASKDFKRSDLDRYVAQQKRLGRL